MSLIIRITLSNPTLRDAKLVKAWRTISIKKGNRDTKSIIFSGCLINAQNVSPKLVQTDRRRINSKRKTPNTTFSKLPEISEYRPTSVSSFK